MKKTGSSRRLRQPRVGEMVARELRERILTGGFEDGMELPKQEELLEEFHVSLPSVREALRILESEGLVTVRRGSQGGAIAHRPNADSISYMFGLVLESRRIQSSDVAVALRELEPVCAALCARREDRATTVLPALEACHRQCGEAMDDAGRYVTLAGEFHEALVRSCGNETMILVVGALERIWSSVIDRLADQAAQDQDFPAADARRESEVAHARLIEAIREGDADTARWITSDHLSESHPVALHFESSPGGVVRLDHLRGR